MFYYRVFLVNVALPSSDRRTLPISDFSHQRCCCRRANSLLPCGPVSAKRFFAALVPGFLLATLTCAQPTQLMIEHNSGPAQLGVIGEANTAKVIAEIVERIKNQTGDRLGGAQPK